MERNNNTLVLVAVVGLGVYLLTRSPAQPAPQFVPQGNSSPHPQGQGTDWGGIITGAENLITGLVKAFGGSSLGQKTQGHSDY